jgi:hypothetical protein
MTNQDISGTLLVEPSRDDDETEEAWIAGVPRATTTSYTGVMPRDRGYPGRRDFGSPDADLQVTIAQRETVLPAGLQ